MKKGMMALILGCALGAAIAIVLPQSVFSVDMGYATVLFLSTLNAAISGVNRRGETAFSLKDFFMEFLFNSVIGILLIYISRKKVAAMEPAAYAALCIKLFSEIDNLRKGRIGGRDDKVEK